MMNTLQPTQSLPDAAKTIAPEHMSSAVIAATKTLLRQHQDSIWKSTDRMMCWLLQSEWILCIVLAIWRSPRTWSGAISHIHPHVWAAIFLGGVIAAGPMVIALAYPGRAFTRHIMAIGLMMMAGLLIDAGGGQIEMHFQIFGSLACIAFYRDWRVVATASLVTAADHITRGIWLPESIYGASYVSGWLTIEHIGWVLFEDVFLIVSCVRGVHEMRGIAQSRALLENSYHHIEQTVQERTGQLRSAQDDLMKAARSAGMAEIATSVLHNVGNVLNSVNISAGIVAGKVRASEVGSLAKVSELLSSHQSDLPAFLTTDERGKLIPGFINDLAECLGDEQTTMLYEVESLTKGIEHIKQIVASQQSMAKSSTIRHLIRPATIVENAIAMQASRTTDQVRLRKRFADIPELMLDQHKVLQILINLISNAAQAVMTRPVEEREIMVSTQIVPVDGGDRLQFEVVDNGIGISAENLKRIFMHGFSTKTDGHGFGLHSAINAAKEMGGSLSVKSDGEGKGAAFTLDLPTAVAEGDAFHSDSPERREVTKEQLSCSR